MKVWWSSLCKLLCLNTIILLLVCLVCDSCVHLANCQCLTCTTFLFLLPYTFFKSTLFSSPFQILFYTLSSGGVAIDVSNLQISINLQRPANSVRCVLKKRQKISGKGVSEQSNVWLVEEKEWNRNLTAFFALKLARRLNSGFSPQQGGRTRGRTWDSGDFKTQEFKTV